MVERRVIASSLDAGIEQSLNRAWQITADFIGRQKASVEISFALISGAAGVTSWKPVSDNAHGLFDALQKGGFKLSAVVPTVILDLLEQADQMGLTWQERNAAGQPPQLIFKRDPGGLIS